MKMRLKTTIDKSEVELLKKMDISKEAKSILLNNTISGTFTFEDNHKNQFTITDCLLGVLFNLILAIFNELIETGGPNSLFAKEQENGYLIQIEKSKREVILICNDKLKLTFPMQGFFFKLSNLFQDGIDKIEFYQASIIENPEYHQIKNGLLENLKQLNSRVV